jgi:hypothetical protein
MQVFASVSSLDSSTKCNTQEIQAMSTNTGFHYAPQPNCRFNADANTGHGFAIFMASVGALRASRSGAG